MEQAAALVNSARRPFILWGQGVVLGRAERRVPGICGEKRHPGGAGPFWAWGPYPPATR
ncbi:MAG: hypothetical protein WKG07_18850 [Hymenobacter sp.]